MRFDCIERRISQFFHGYGHLLARQPWPFIVFPLLFTAAMSVGFLHLEPLTDAIYLFTPVGSASKMERQAIHEKWPLTENNYIPGRAVTQSREAQVIALAKDDGNILEHQYSEAVYRLDMYIQNRVKVYHKGKEYSYKNLCLQYKGGGCYGNKHVHILSDLYNHGLNITFPYFRFGTESGYLGASLGGVSLMDSGNGTHILAGARAWFMLYHVKFYPTETSYISGLWENALGEALKNYPEDPYITVTYFHSQTLADELKMNADSLVPSFVVAFALLVIFSTICSVCFIDNTYFIDWSLSKPILSILGVVNAGMGIVTGMGLLLLVGMPFNDIVMVMPFLVVVVGTDNMFLMVAAIRRTPRSHSVGERMAECMSDAAVSILITASTDALSFGVGAITTIPAVQIFCVYTGFAITFAFIYQITFFAALLAIYVRFENEGLHTVFFHAVTTSEHDLKVASVPQKLFSLGSRVPHNSKNDVKEQWTSRFIGSWYAPLLMNPVARGLAMVWFVIYLAGAYYGCTQLKEGLKPLNLLVEDTYAIPHYNLLEEYFWKYGVTLQVVVNNAPDMRDAHARDRVKAMIGDMCTTRHSVGKESLQFWLDEMEIYYTKQLDTPIRDDAFYGLVEHWLASKYNNPWTEDLVWQHFENGSSIITSFRFIIGMRDMSSTTEQTDATNVFREVAVTYGYVVSAEPLPKDKIKEALSSLGWPLCQGAMSTIIAVIVLADVPAYMVITFFKTVVLSISLGLLHGIVFLPVMLSLFVRGCCIVDSPRTPQQKSKVTPMLEKGLTPIPPRYSPSMGYASGPPSEMLTSSPIAGVVPEGFIVFEDSPSYDSTGVISPTAAAAVHNRSRQSTKSPEHRD